MSIKYISIKTSILTAFSLLVFIWSTNAQSLTSDKNRWVINKDGGITWVVDGRIPHVDNIEMSGERLSVIIEYGIDEKAGFTINRTIVWPLLRNFPNKTRDHLKRVFNWDIVRSIYVNGAALVDEKVSDITLNGLMVVKSTFKPGIACTRTFFPSTTLAVFIEEYKLTNTSDKSAFIEIPKHTTTYTTDPVNGIEGKYIFSEQSQAAQSIRLEPGKSVMFAATFQATKEGEDIGSVNLDIEEQQRKDHIKLWWDNLQLETPDEVLNRAFAFAKIRASESIYRTKGGLMHGPGGGAYYAAIWANDEAEYISPFFPFLGYNIGNQASLNAYRQFAKFINPEYKPIPSSITAQGDNFWQGAGDRGDAAMVAYGASRFALSLGDKISAQTLWPLIEWTLEFCKRKINKDGVVNSDSDELEGRFPAGSANLSTSSLYYDALLSAAYLGKDLNKPASQVASYKSQAKKLKIAIAQYFGAKVEGYETYRYYSGNDVLRAWICMPLAMDILDRKEGTIAALFSSRLWTPDGLATQAGKETFWDRSTLYALRGVFAAGEKEKALEFLKYYSNRRLLGEHVPYAVEAYPEGNQRHLSAESGLYCRIYTEGMFGIRPTGLKSFQITPHLPTQWNYMALRKIHAFNGDLDILVSRANEKVRLNILSGSKQIYNDFITEGKPVDIKL